MKKQIIKQLSSRFFSHEKKNYTLYSCEIKKALNKVEQLKNNKQYKEALELVNKIEKNNPEMSFKTIPFIKGEIKYEIFIQKGNTNRLKISL